MERIPPGLWTERTVPVILMGVDFWKPLTEWIKSSLLERYGKLSAEAKKVPIQRV